MSYTPNRINGPTTTNPHNQSDDKRDNPSSKMVVNIAISTNF